MTRWWCRRSSPAPGCDGGISFIRQGQFHNHRVNMSARLMNQWKRRNGHEPHRFRQPHELQMPGKMMGILERRRGTETYMAGSKSCHLSTVQPKNQPFINHRHIFRSTLNSGKTKLQDRSASCLPRGSCPRHICPRMKLVNMVLRGKAVLYIKNFPGIQMYLV